MKTFKKVEALEMPLFDELLSQVPATSKRFISRSMAISEQIAVLLEERKLNQNKLAALLGKSDAEISKWMCGSHNFTLRTISAVEAVLEADIIVTPFEVSQNIFRYTSKLFTASPTRTVAKIQDAKRYEFKSEAKEETELAAA